MPQKKHRTLLRKAQLDWLFFERLGGALAPDAEDEHRLNHIWQRAHQLSDPIDKQSLSLFAVKLEQLKHIKEEGLEYLFEELPAWARLADDIQQYLPETYRQRVFSLASGFKHNAQAELTSDDFRVSKIYLREVYFLQILNDLYETTDMSFTTTAKQ